MFKKLSTISILALTLLNNSFASTTPVEHAYELLAECTATASSVGYGNSTCQYNIRMAKFILQKVTHEETFSDLFPKYDQCLSSGMKSSGGLVADTDGAAIRCAKAFYPYITQEECGLGRNAISMMKAARELMKVCQQSKY